MIDILQAANDVNYAFFLFCFHTGTSWRQYFWGDCMFLHSHNCEHNISGKALGNVLKFGTNLLLKLRMN